MNIRALIIGVLRILHPTFGRWPAVVLGLFFVTVQAKAQDISVAGREPIAGTVQAVRPGELVINSDSGRVRTYQIQDKSDRAMAIAGTAYDVPAEISLVGDVPARLISQGRAVRFEAKCDVDGRCDGVVRELTLVSEDAVDQLHVNFLERPDDPSIAARVSVVGRVVTLSANRLKLQVAAARWARQGQIQFELAADARLNIHSDSLAWVVPGDRVIGGQALRLATGQRIVRQIEISPSGQRRRLIQSVEERLEDQFRMLSDEPQRPRELRSQHFLLTSDLSDRSAQVLLAKLESVFMTLAGYYQRRPEQLIRCVVVRDPSQWNDRRFEPEAIQRIEAGLGVTVGPGPGAGRRATVYSCADHAIVQHEAVHAFCWQTFGELGPTWYAEGMAELGRNWNRNQRGVSIDPVEIDYLKNAAPKSIQAIVARRQVTGDSWQAYARRWALCHLLAQHSEFRNRFKQLGIDLMSGRETSLSAIFGKDVPKINCEYQQFVGNLSNGYRVDLCQLDWNVVGQDLITGMRLDQAVQSRRGWQATSLLAREGVVYDFATRGVWGIAPNSEIDAQGDAAGRGKLVGAWMKDHELTPAFDLGARGQFVGRGDCQLYVRCQEGWGALADNAGQVTLFLRVAKKQVSPE